MSRRAVFIPLFLATIAAGLALRWPQLDLRPMHGDEAVHAYKLNELWKSGTYRYDPEEYHGPTLYFLTLPSLWLSGASDWRQTTAANYRIVPVLCGVGMVILLVLLTDGLGRSAVVVAGGLSALSPASVFYSRYYIQETLLVCFTLLLIAAAWRYVQTRRLRWALLAGAAVGLMHATKETCVIALAALAAAGVATWWWHRRHKPAGSRPRVHVAPLIGAAVAAVLVSSALLSTGFTNLAGPVDSLRAYATYFTRAGGGIHTHPWYYYLQLLLYSHTPAGPVWSEALIFALGFVGIVAAFANTARRHSGRATYDPRLARFLAIYTILLTLTYSAIPYKTPWCTLGFLHGWILLAGIGTISLLDWASAGFARLATVMAILAVATPHLGVQSWRASHSRVFCADPRNPYVYAHPVGDVVKLERYLTRLTDAAPADNQTIIKVYSPNPWPLPWYLRSFDHVGYWENVPDAPEADADVVLVSTTLRSAFDASRRADYQCTTYGLRRDEILDVCIQQPLWNAFIERAESANTSVTPAVSP